MLKTCKICDDVKEIELFYHRKTNNKIYYRNTCKDCYNKSVKKRVRKNRLDEGGSTRVKPNPNTYMDKVQKQQTFEFLLACGWKFNEEKGIWYKEGIKDDNGNFLNLKPINKKYYRSPNRKYKYAHLLDKMLEMYTVKKFSYNHIATLLNVNSSTVRKMITKELKLR